MTLYNKDLPRDQRKQIYLHQVVAAAFIPNPDNLPEINHKDLNKSNCAVSNLEWSTQADNMIHAEKGGRKFNGAYQKLSKEKADEIRSKYNGKYRKDVNTVTLAKEYNVSTTMIHQILSGQSWK